MVFTAMLNTVTLQSNRDKLKATSKQKQIIKNITKITVYRAHDYSH